MKNTTRKLICVLIALALSVGMLALASFAASTETQAVEEGEMSLFTAAEEPNEGAAEEGEMNALGEAVSEGEAPDAEAPAADDLYAAAVCRTVYDRYVFTRRALELDYFRLIFGPE